MVRRTDNRREFAIRKGVGRNLGKMVGCRVNARIGSQSSKFEKQHVELTE